LNDNHNGHHGGELQAWAADIEAVAVSAARIAHTAFVPDSLKVYRPPQGNQRRGELDRDATIATVTCAIVTGSELGLKPMQSLSAINVIKGKPTLSAVAQRALLLAHGHEIVVVEATATRAKVKARRAETDTWQESTWTLDRAQQLGLFPGGPDSQWRRQPIAMLVARASAEVARWVAADAVLGVPYVSEELDSDGQPLIEWVSAREPDTAEVDGSPPVQRGRSRRRPAAPRAALPSAPPPPIGPPVPDPGGPPRESYPTETEQAEQARPISDAQRAKINAMLRQAGIHDRDEAHGLISYWLARDVDSANDLTMTEASKVIERLGATIAANEPPEDGGDGDAAADQRPA